VTAPQIPPPTADGLPRAWPWPAGAGLVALVDARAAVSWADALLARCGEGPLARCGEGLVVWAATGAAPVRQAMATAGLPGVRAVVLAPAAGARPVAVALGFAAHLAVVRAGAGDGGGCVTSPTRPATPPGVVRIPHLLSVRRAGAVTDVVVWELMTAGRATGWLGGPLPEQRFFERHLAGLLRLRAAARTGRLPLTAAGTRLARLLGGRPLSIRLVYQRPRLFRALLTGHDLFLSQPVGTAPAGPSSDHPWPG
jgi:hypothetical protein